MWSWGKLCEPNPIYYDPTTSGWHFYDEVWVDTYGPFNSREDAVNELSRYLNWLENA